MSNYAEENISVKVLLKISLRDVDAAILKAYLDLGGEVLHDGADELCLVDSEAGDIIAWSGWCVGVFHDDGASVNDL